MDGVEATRRIREHWPAEQRPRIIAMTAHALSGDRERYLNEGMDDYVSKPVRVEELVAALERCQPLAGEWRLENGEWRMENRDWKSGLEAESQERESRDQKSPIPNTQYPISNTQYFDRAQHRSPIDREVLAQFTEMMGEDAPALVAELIDVFLEDTPRLVAALREGVVAGDVGAVERAAHTMKSSSASLGAMTLSTLCKELEAIGRAGALDGAAERVAQIETEYERVRIALEAVISDQ
ncbi:MAG: Hpt domain-containing protein, partial [Anaerolineae bacterium]